ncbi:MAG: hypothetical protein ABI239_11560 [Aquihabitans sp.]
MIHTPRRRHFVGIAVCAVLFPAIVAGCSSDEPDPAQQRRDRVETRLGESFSKDQADCIVETIDDDTLRALDRTVDLPADSAPMLTYTVAVRTCVNGTDTAPAPTTTDGETTTTAEG